jgi:hypothetical protein
MTVTLLLISVSQLLAPMCPVSVCSPPLKNAARIVLFYYPVADRIIECAMLSGSADRREKSG